MKKKTLGAPTKYKKEYNQLAYELCLLGLTDRQLAEAFEVAESTISDWKKKHKAFSEALREGKLKADGKVARALYRRATGFKYNEVTFEKIDDKHSLLATSDDEIAIDAYRKKIVTKYVVPDAGAAMSWLKNRQKDLWRDKQTIEFENMSDEQIDELFSKAKKIANDQERED